MFTVVVTGSRSWTNEDRIRDFCEFVKKLGYESSQVRVVHGDARGADRLVAQIAAEFGYTVIAEPAKWSTYGKRAGYMRNEYMLKRYDPDVVVAFWDGESLGTAHTIRLAKLRNIRTIVVRDKVDANA